MFIFAPLNLYFMTLINIPGEIIKMIFGSHLKKDFNIEQVTWFELFLLLGIIIGNLYLLIMPLIVYYSDRKSNEEDSFPE